VTPSELTPKRLYETLAQRLEELILQGAYSPGEKLPAAHELAKEYGVSQSVVRDATRSLEGKGLLQVKQGVGTLVASDASAALTDAIRRVLRSLQVTQPELIDLARTLETEIAVLAAERRTDQDLARLHDILADYATAASEGSWEDAQACHARLHTEVVEAAHNRAILGLLGPLLDVIRPSAMADHLGGSALLTQQQHARILECIQQGDRQATRAEMEEHFASPWAWRRNHADARGQPESNA
jgi:GntR family transcriptional repressor for pyruvate dehydrogenase complex